MIFSHPSRAKVWSESVVGACFLGPHAYRLSFLAGIAILAPMLRATDGQGANCTLSGRRPARLRPLRSLPQRFQLVQIVQKAEAAYHLRSSEIGRRAS